jgi:hypothetical protein
MDISARYARIQRHAAIAAAATTQRHAQVYHPRHASVAQPAMEESMHHGPRNTQRGRRRYSEQKQPDGRYRGYF